MGIGGQKKWVQPTCSSYPGAQDRRDINVMACCDYTSFDSQRAEKEKVGCVRASNFSGMAHAALFAYDFVSRPKNSHHYKAIVAFGTVNLCGLSKCGFQWCVKETNNSITISVL